MINTPIIQTTATTLLLLCVVAFVVSCKRETTPKTPTPKPRDVQNEPPSPDPLEKTTSIQQATNEVTKRFYTITNAHDALKGLFARQTSFDVTLTAEYPKDTIKTHSWRNASGPKFVDCLHDPKKTGQSSWGGTRRLGKTCDTNKDMVVYLDTPRRYGDTTIESCDASCCTLKEPKMRTYTSLTLQKICYEKREQTWKITSMHVVGLW